MKSDDIRTQFLNFFQEKGHLVIPSSSLVPEDDPTLLFTSAGMVQVKPYFLGKALPPSRRLASCQKCFRTTDIETVGDGQHLTFFEMLGNFSVGDYFKQEAIAWAWEFVTRCLGLPPQRLWTTVFLDDDEAFAHWLEIGVPRHRVLRLGEEDNFWGPAGDSGPCGPCSEIHYDFGEKVGCGRPHCAPGCKCGRFLEIWNLVFTQFDQDKEGRRTPLPNPNIDTGMGLERIAAVMQHTPLVYDTDLFSPITETVSWLAAKKQGQDKETDRAIRVISEHARSVTFLIADGVIPSNEGRGYVLRRVLRRTALFGRKLGLKGPSLAPVIEAVINRMGGVYPELKRNSDTILKVVEMEESRFGSTLEGGLNILKQLIEQAEKERRSTISGEQAFLLYDTYGFPIELTLEVASERGFQIDSVGFEQEMERQRERARAVHKFGGEERKGQAWDLPPTVFVGYDRLSSVSSIQGLRVGGKANSIAALGDDVEIVLEETPFYAEMGGQVGDTGRIFSPRGEAEIGNTQRPLPHLVVHQGKVTRGELRLGEQVTAQVHEGRRLDIGRNHTATHLLHAALRQVLGPQAQQRGSLVAPERLRFDFSSLLAPTREELMQVQRLVNERIRQNLPLRTRNTTYAKAVEEGVIALFGEKYGEEVRVVEIGDISISAELCGGTHLSSTGEIGFFLITAESSIGAGLRRIEALTGKGAETHIENQASILEDLAGELKGKKEELPQRLATLVAELEKERKRTQALERELLKVTVVSLAAQAELVDGGVKAVVAKVPAGSAQALREAGDLLRDRLRSAVIILATLQEGKPSFMAMVTPDLVARGFHAGNIVSQVARLTGGGGGGRAELAQAGGKDSSKLEKALNLARELVRAQAQKTSYSGGKS